MKRTVKIFLVGLMTLASTLVHAQQEVEMADTLRTEGKIYVVVAIILVIFLGLISYLYLIERKVTRLEKRMPKEKSDA